MTERFKVFFHDGDMLGLKTRVLKGEAWIDDSGLNVKSSPSGSSILIPKRDLIKVDMFRLHGLGRVIQIDHRTGRLFLSVVRLMIGQFALINFFRTGRLHKALSEMLASNRA